MPTLLMSVGAALVVAGLVALVAVRRRPRSVPPTANPVSANTPPDAE